MKNKNILSGFLMSVMLVAFSACQDFEELQSNPNKTEAVPPSLVFNGVLNDLYERPWSLEHRQNQFWSCNYNYYGTNEYWSSASFNFMTLKNVVKMEQEAERFSELEARHYKALGKFLKAYFYVRMTQRVGDLPLEGALQGIEEVTPAYDSQKDIYVQVLNWLEEANTELSELIVINDNRLSGDIYFDNDLTKWQKVVNTFALRVLISLSTKESDPDLNVKARFATIVGDPVKYPVMESLDDNLQYAYNGTSNLYPTNPGNRGFDKGRYNLTATYVQTLTDLKDPRVFVVANPAKKKINDGLDPADFDAYIGAPAGESLDNMAVKAGNGEYSFANQKRYYGSLKGPEPGVQISYPELCFTIAEGINRGWVSGDAGAYYERGIIASMKFYGIEEGTVINITESDEDEVIGTATVLLAEYLDQESVSYKGNNEAGLEQILVQKYLSFFQQAGQEAYFNFRRTGIPEFHEGPGTGNGGIIPRRWLYPVSEATNNTVNYKAALQRQFGSESDNVNAELWIEK